MMKWPKPDQYVAVSTTAKPVTQTAETAVNRATNAGAAAAPALETGSINAAVPTRIAARNDIGMRRAGCSSARVTNEAWSD